MCPWASHSPATSLSLLIREMGTKSACLTGLPRGEHENAQGAPTTLSVSLRVLGGHCLPSSASLMHPAISPPQLGRLLALRRESHPISKPIPFPVFLGGSRDASEVGDVGKSVVVETKVWLAKAP